MVKVAAFAASKWSKLISRKIWVAEKSWNFHIEYCPLGCPGLYFLYYTSFSTISVTNDEYLTFKIIDANKTGLIDWRKDFQPFILLKNGHCHLDRKTRKLKRKQRRLEENSNMIRSQFLQSIWRNRIKRDTFQPDRYFYMFVFLH